MNLFLIALVFLWGCASSRNGASIIQTGMVFQSSSNSQAMPFRKLRITNGYLFETLEKGESWTFGDNGTEEIVQGEWSHAEIIDGTRLLVQMPDKVSVGVFNIEKNKIESTYPGVYIWSTLVDGYNMVFSAAALPSEKNNYEVDILGHFPLSIKPVVFKKVGGIAVRKHPLRLFDQGFLNSGLNPLSKTVVNFGKFIAINSTGIDGLPYSQLVSKEGVMLTNKIGLVDSVHTTTKDSMNSQFHKILKENYITATGTISGTNLAKQLYLPIDETGKFISLPPGVVGVTPLKINGANYGIGWILLKPEQTELHGYIHFGQFQSMPSDISGLTSGKQVQVFRYGGEHHNIAYKNSNDEWILMAESDPKFLNFFKNPEKLASDDLVAVFKERQAAAWQKHYLENKAYYDELDRVRNEQYARERAAFAAQYERVKQQRTQCSHFELAKKVGYIAVSYFMENCGVSDYHLQEARYFAVDPVILEKAEAKIAAAKKRREQEKAAQISSHNSSYMGSYSSSVQSQSSSPAPYVAPSQNLSQQQRYQYEVHLNKTIFGTKY